MKKWYGVLGLLFVSAAVVTHAQWLNYPTPGVPRLPNGKVDLTAKTPRTAEGHPDLSGVWMHELTSIAELRRLYGSRIDDAAKTDIPGMEIGTQHKYLLNILIDFPDRESMVRPQTQPAAARGGSSAPRRARAGFPVA
jgi:hypothetical protein